MMGASLGAAFLKDLRLLVRDRVGLVFLTLAPMIVITVAGFSLASLYGANPTGATAYLLPVVDEDGGAIGAAVRDRLAREPSVSVEPVGSRAEAMTKLEGREAGAVLVIPAGTSAAQEAGQQSKLLLLTDPVKYLEIANVRSLVEELRHGIEVEARRRAAQRLEEAAASAERTRAEFVRVGAEAKQRLAALRDRLARAHEESAAAVKATKERSEKLLHDAAGRAAERGRAAAAARLHAALEPVRRYLAELAEREREFTQWLAAVRSRAGKLADRMPPPPAPPELPAEIRDLAEASPDELARRLLGNDAAKVELPPLPEIVLPPIPQLPDLASFDLPKEPGAAASLPGAIEIEEISATGAPPRLNTFDQNVPGFSVTFLLLGVLLGVSLSLLDERDWGTLERLRAMPAPFSAVLVGKLASRLAVGIVQMVLLFAVGRAAFGISLGPQPWALLLPTAGIVFAGTSFGLVVAGLASSREAVLPIGSIVIVTMAAVGGCWWPIDLEPPWMRSVALAFPTTWAMSAYNDLMIRRQPAVVALRPTAVLFAHGVLYVALGLWLFHRREGRGG
jgi:ABC-type multidrug transport system permease subunit